MKILIIGGSRFSGRYLMENLASQKHQLTVINRGKSSITYPANCEHILVDRTDKTALLKALENREFDWVFDMVAMKGEETQILIERFKGKIKKFIHISTGSVYDGKNISQYLTMPIFEEDPLGPISETEHWYAREKRICEQYLFEAYAKEKFPMTIIRPTFIYGPNNYIYREAYFFDRIKQGLPVYISKPENMFFDLVHAEDVARLCILAAENDNATGQAFNATSGEFLSGEQMALLVGKIIGKEPRILHYQWEDLKEVGWSEDLPLYPYTSDSLMVFSMVKSLELLNFKPKKRLHEGLKETYEWYQSDQGRLFRTKFAESYSTPEMLQKLEKLHQNLS